ATPGVKSSRAFVDGRAGLPPLRPSFTQAMSPLPARPAAVMCSEGQVFREQCATSAASWKKCRRWVLSSAGRVPEGSDHCEPGERLKCPEWKKVTKQPATICP